MNTKVVAAIIGAAVIAVIIIGLIVYWVMRSSMPLPANTLQENQINKPSNGYATTFGQCPQMSVSSSVGWSVKNNSGKIYNMHYEYPQSQCGEGNRSWGSIKVQPNTSVSWYEVDQKGNPVSASPSTSGKQYFVLPYNGIITTNTSTVVDLSSLNLDPKKNYVKIVIGSDNSFKASKA